LIFKGEHPACDRPLFNRFTAENSPAPAHYERTGKFALCGERQGLSALDPKTFL